MSLFTSIAEIHYPVSVLFRCSFLLVIGWIAYGAVSRANPRWQVLVLRLTAAGLLSIPLLVLLVPEIEAPVLPAPPIRTPPSMLQETQPNLPLSALPGPSNEPVNDAAGRIETEPIAVRRTSEVDLMAWIDTHVISIVIGIWLTGLAAILMGQMLHRRRFLSLLRRSTPAPDKCVRIADKVARSLGITREFQILFSEEVFSPSLAGLVAPVILLPERMREKDYHKDLPAVFAHELSHLKAGDVQWTSIIRLITSILWFHPLLWGLRAAYCASCEKVCDAIAVGLVGDRQAYSGTLARIALEASGRKPVFNAIPMARRPEVCERLDLLKRNIFSAPLTLRCLSLALVFGLFMVVGLAGLKVVHAGSEADREPDSEVVRIRQLLYGLRFETVGNTENYARTIKDLTDHASVALPEVVAELYRATRQDRYTETRFLVFTIRAIGDVRAIPALLDALHDGTPRFASDYGGFSVADPELLRFMKRHARPDDSFTFGLGRPVNEIRITLEKMIGHSIETPVNYVHYYGPNGRMVHEESPQAIQATWNTRRDVANRWRQWWLDNWTGDLSAEEMLADNETWKEMSNKDSVAEVGIHPLERLWTEDFSFSNEIEMFLPDVNAENHNVYIDFDGAKLISFDYIKNRQIEDIFERRRAESLWIAETGADASTGKRGYEKPGATDDMIWFYGLWDSENGYIWKMDDSIWNSSKSEFVQTVRNHLPDVSSNYNFDPRSEQYPITFLVKTGEGGIGLVQILGDDETLKGVRLRFKMIRGRNGASPSNRNTTKATPADEKGI